MQERALDGCDFVCTDCNIVYIYICISIQDNRSMFWTSSEHGNQKNPPFLKLHIELLKQFEDSRTLSNFIEPLLSKNRTEQP